MKMFPFFLLVLCVALAVDFTIATTEESSTSRSDTTPMEEGKTQPRSFGPTDDLRSTAVSEITVLPTEKHKEEVVSTDSSGGKTVGWTNTSTVGAASTSLTPAGIQITTEPSHYSTVKESASTSRDLTPPATSATPSETASASSPLLTSASQLEVTSEVSSHISSGTNISVFTQSPNIHSSSATTASGDVRSVSTPVMDSTSTVTQTSTSTEFQTQSTSTIGGSSSAGSLYTLTSTDSLNLTSSFSTSPAGIIIPDPPMKSTPKSTITTPQQVSKGPTMTEVPSCSTRSMEKYCLIIIAVLAAIATIFIICTIVLCTKLSARRYSMRRNPQGAEMMCISSLLPDRNPNYSRQRNPVRNGILVIPGGGDSDDDGGDNLTLSSFLRDNDHYV